MSSPPPLHVAGARARCSNRRNGAAELYHRSTALNQALRRKEKTRGRRLDPVAAVIHHCRSLSLGGPHVAAVEELFSAHGSPGSFAVPSAMFAITKLRPSYGLPATIDGNGRENRWKGENRWLYRLLFFFERNQGRGAPPRLSTLDREE
nr:hypothetical protein Itr_chr12CG17950 [Ipomoea trifida]